MGREGQKIAAKAKYEGKEFTVKCGWTCVVEDYIRNDNVIVRWNENGKTQKVSACNLTSGMVRPVDFPSIVGIGINDMKGKVEIGKGSIYQKWVSMIKRCYCEHYVKNKPTYLFAEVEREWLRLSNFYEWASQYKGVSFLTLDKDIYGSGVLYSPENCILVPNYINYFFLGMDKPLRFNWKPHLNKWEVWVENPTKGLKRGVGSYKGVYKTKEEALDVYKKAKKEYLKIILDRYKQESFYMPEVEWKIINNKIFDRISYV